MEVDSLVASRVHSVTTGHRPCDRILAGNALLSLVISRTILNVVSLMNLGRPPVQFNGVQITSKFVGIYSKLFQGVSPRQISPQQGQQRFFSDLLDLKVDRTYLEGELDKITKEACLGRMKVGPLLY